MSKRKWGLGPRTTVLPTTVPPTLPQNYHSLFWRSLLLLFVNKSQTGKWHEQWHPYICNKCTAQIKEMRAWLWIVWPSHTAIVSWRDGQMGEEWEQVGMKSAKPERETVEIMDRKHPAMTNGVVEWIRTNLMVARTSIRWSLPDEPWNSAILSSWLSPYVGTN